MTFVAGELDARVVDFRTRRLSRACPIEPMHARKALEVPPNGPDNANAAVRVLEPPNRYEANRPATLGAQEKQFGVPKPAPVLDEGEQALCAVPAHRLEPALSVAEPRPEQRVDKKDKAA